MKCTLLVNLSFLLLPADPRDPRCASKVNTLVYSTYTGFFGRPEGCSRFRPCCWSHRWSSHGFPFRGKVSAKCLCRPEPAAGGTQSVDGKKAYARRTNIFENQNLKAPDAQQSSDVDVDAVGEPFTSSNCCLRTL